MDNELKFELEPGKPEIPPNNDQFLIIIGAMKCATTSLYLSLQGHSQIAACACKEPAYFASSDMFRLNVNRYAELWPQFDPSRHKFALEASTAYTKFPGEDNIPQNMQQYGLNPWIIYVVRNPYERIISEYNFARAQPWFGVKDRVTNEGYIARSNYYLQLEQYNKIFGKKRLIVVDFDDFRRDQTGTVEGILARLGLQPDPLWTHRFHRNKSVIDTKTSAPSTISPDQYRVIKTALADDMKRFASEYGFPVEKWGF